ncbi:putative transmembrane protein [Gregarina niphandrodes]|uniref:Transmembrane protein n=1 Tax=Gregarina niphandrodes TaxID=110365 RepID=A0A023B390_GRENI|nr:putative transmembrane protein [Gregarina niphandrodes]EZG55159.1 putative transmembrane protein [Gregarina niphandrodes]|eukprot:XP_011131747.1 putative transmembrane protein [Gregarina niphandrodes]
MAKKKSKVDPRLTALHKTIGWVWKVASGVACLGCLLTVIGASTTSWLTVAPYTVRFIQNFAMVTDTAQVKNYLTTYMGLFMVYFNEGVVIEPWYQRVSTVCGGYTLLAKAAATNGLISLWDNSCNTDCLAHYKMRCSYYKSLSSIGFALLALLLVILAASITSLSWLYIFGKSPQFLQLSWLGGGILTIAGAVGFIVIGRMAHSALNLQSVYPALNMGYSFYLTVAGGSLLVLAGLLIAYAAYQDRQEEKRLKEEAIIKQEAGGVNFRLPGAMNRPTFLPPPRMPQLK